MSSRSLIGSETESVSLAFNHSTEWGACNGSPEQSLGDAVTGSLDEDPFAAHPFERDESVSDRSSTHRLPDEGHRQTHDANELAKSSPEASVTPFSSQDDSVMARREGSTEGSGEDSQPGEGSGEVSAAMNLEEYETRFVHRAWGRHISADSSFQSPGPQERSERFALPEESIDFGRESFGAAEEEEHVLARTASAASSDDAILLDPNTGRSMTEAEAIAMIRAEIAAAHAQAQQMQAQAAAAVASDSGFKAQGADNGEDDEDVTGTSMMTEATHFSDADLPQLAPNRDSAGEKTEAQGKKSSGGDLGEHKIVVREKTQTTDPLLRSAGDEEINFGLQTLAADGAEMMNALPEPHYHQISVDLLKSSSPVAVAVRRHQNHMQQGFSKASADACQLELEAELESAGALVLRTTMAAHGQSAPTKSTVAAHGHSAPIPEETEKQRERRLSMERLKKRNTPTATGAWSLEFVCESVESLGATVKALNIGQPKHDPRAAAVNQSPLAAIRAERRASYSAQDDTSLESAFPLISRTASRISRTASNGIARTTSNVSEVRQFRSLQTRQHVSDIHNRIHDMQDHMANALLDDSMSIATHFRVFQKFDVVAGILHALGRQMSANKNLPLVLRDKHDESMRLASIECLSIVKEAGVESYTILKQLHDVVVETQSWLKNIEDEVVRISEGTVILATSDASELQPVFEQLYIRWQVEKSVVGRAFQEWHNLARHRKDERDRLAIESVIFLLQKARVGCLRDFFTCWAGNRHRKKRHKKIQQQSKLVLKFNSKVWTVYLWKKITSKNKTAKNLACKLRKRFLASSVRLWAQLSEEMKEAEFKKRKAQKLAHRKMGIHNLQAWYNAIRGKFKLKSKLRAAEEITKIKSCTKCYNAWNALYHRHKYHRQEMSRRLKDRQERDFKEWRLIARILKTQHKTATFLSTRIKNRLKDQTFQLWCESIEEEIIKKIRIAKLISQNRIFWLTSSFRKWAWFANLTQKGICHFKVRRLFKSLKRYILLLKEQRRVFSKWSETNNDIRFHETFARWQDYIMNLRSGVAKLRAICEEQGGFDEQLCFEKWRATESKCRLWRYQRRHIQKRQNTNLRIKYWKLWLLKALGKEDLDKASRHAIRMGHTRLRHHKVRKAFQVLSSYLTYMLAKKRKIRQVVVCNQRRKMQLAWSVWVRLLVAARAIAGLYALHLVRFKRRHLKLFSKNVKHRVSRMLFGAWCGECKRPFDRKEYKDYTQNPEEVEVRLNERERGIVAAKRQRHHIRHLLQCARESWSEGSEDESASIGKHDQFKQAGLLAQYLREIEEAKAMMGWQTDAHDQSEESKRSEVSVKLRQRPLQRRQVSRERDHIHSVWSQLRNELLSTQRDLHLHIPGEPRASDREHSADGNSVYQGKELQHVRGQRYRTNQDENLEHSLDQENMAPYNSSELRHKVLQALELAKGELATPHLYQRTRADECGLPFLNMLPTHDFEHEVVAEKKTAASNAYQLRHEHHLPHAQFVQNWGQQLRNDRPLSTLIEPKAPRPPSAAKPSHLVGAGLGFNPQYRVKRREVDPRLEKSPYSTTNQTLPDGDKASSIRIARQKAVSAPVPSRYHVDELAEYMVAAGGGAQGSDKDEQIDRLKIDRLKSALQYEHVP